MDNKIKNSLDNILNWLNKNGYEGYDPYDVKANPFILKITEHGNKNRFTEIFREGLFELLLLFPRVSRNILKIKKTINPKGMALLVNAYLNLYRSTKEINYLNQSEKCLKWLDNNSVKINSGIGWGYPFDWQAKKLIPAYTPNGVVTTAVGEAFWQWYLITKDQKFLNQCRNICNFLASLPIDHIDEKQLCFSYTPLYINHVHNLNLFVAEFLIKIGLEIENQDWVDLGNKAVNYSISNQLTDGSFDYDGPPEKLRYFRDNYHTGFILRMLYSIWQLTKSERVFNSLTKCYNHYVNNFFIEKIIPKFKPESVYRIDIHSCSESILCLSTLSKDFPEGLEIAGNVLNWTIDNLQDVNGYFYHGIFKSRFGFTFKSRIPYFRWAQSWMLLAISEYFFVHKQNEKV